MEFINSLIIAIDEAGMRQNAYSTINSIFWYVALLVGFLNGIKLKTGIIPTLITLAVHQYLSGPIVSAIIFIEDGFRMSGRANGVYIFVFIPLLGYLIAKVLKKSYKQIWDLYMVIPLTMFAGARIACTVTGCCRGYPCSWGVYNPEIGEILFPVQLLESLISIFILAYIFWREKKRNFVADGRNVPLILIIYGIARFFTEFLNYDSYFLGFTWMQVHCILMLIVGMICLRIIRKSEKQQMHLEPSVPLSVPAEELDKT